MKLVTQFLYIISFSYLGEVISKLFHLSMPGSVIGMLLLFFALYFKVLDVAKVALVADFLLDNLSILFLPAGVGIMVYYPVIKETWWSLLLVVTVTTLLTISLVGKTVQAVKQKYEEGNSKFKEEEGSSDEARVDK